MNYPSRVCISHSKDVDGVGTAAILKLAMKTETILADYGDLQEKLKTVGRVEALYICDLGLSQQTIPGFLKEVSRISRTASVHYIDHHPLPEGAEQKIKRAGVDLMHSLEECACVLSYMKFKEKIPKEAAIIAAYGAITDYMDFQPQARRIIGRYDRQFLMLEATLLSYAIGRQGDDPKFLVAIVDELARLEYPHRIKKVLGYASEQAEKTAKLIELVKVEGKRMKNLAYMTSKDRAGGIVANMLIGAFDVKVGVAIKAIKEEDVFEVSIRGSEDSTFHLGREVQKIAGELEGYGGGHPKAAGGRMPLAKLETFLHKLDTTLT